LYATPTAPSDRKVVVMLGDPRSSPPPSLPESPLLPPPPQAENVRKIAKSAIINEFLLLFRKWKMENGKSLF